MNIVCVIGVDGDSPSDTADCWRVNFSGSTNSYVWKIFFDKAHMREQFDRITRLRACSAVVVQGHALQFASKDVPKHGVIIEWVANVVRVPSQQNLSPVQQKQLLQMGLDFLKTIHKAGLVVGPLNPSKLLVTLDHEDSVGLRINPLNQSRFSCVEYTAPTSVTNPKLRDYWSLYASFSTLLTGDKPAREWQPFTATQLTSKEVESILASDIEKGFNEMINGSYPTPLTEAKDVPGLPQDDEDGLTRENLKS